MKYDFDLIVIGSGAAGIAAARQAAGLRQKVAIIEKARLGGSEVQTRDVPYNASLHFSHLYSQAVYGSRFGLSSANLRFNYPTVAHWRERVVEKVSAEVRHELQVLGVEIYRGRAHFINSHEISVGREGRLSARKFLIATGTEPKNSGISGTENVPYLTPDDALKVERPPKTVMIVGGGATGVELAQYFAELGSKVAIAELSERLLPKEDEEVGQVIEQYFTKRFDIKVLPQTRVVAIERDSISEKVIFLRNGQEKLVRVETVIIATGSSPAVDIGLENAGVELNRDGSVKVDKTLQTSVRNIFAAGDVIGPGGAGSSRGSELSSGDLSSTERATYEGDLASRNMFSRSPAEVNYSGFIRVTNTEPQIATVGMTEDDLVRRDRKYNSIVLPLSEVTASKTEDFKMGFIKMISGKDGRILGATVMAPGAAEIIQEVAVMVRHGFSIVEIASTPHVASSWSDLVRLAARELM